MGKVQFIIGLILIVLSVIAIGLYISHGNWQVAIIVLISSVLGKLFLGIVETVALPLTLPAVALAKRGKLVLSTIFLHFHT